tara:strand:+ start:4307 stop:4642 length:336 start_codon:yes stop_codon:yes gene_type:complete
MKSLIKEADYVCEPSNLSIKLRYAPKGGGTKITFYIDNVAALERFYRVNPSTDRGTYDAAVVRLCHRWFESVGLDEFIERLSADEYLKGKYIYTHLRKVLTKSGRKVWEKS